MSAINGYITNNQLEYFRESLKQVYATKSEVYNKIEIDTNFLRKGEATVPVEHSHNPVTEIQDGFMKKEDKVKLNGIAANANKYVHPENHPASMIKQDDNHRFVTQTQLNLIDSKYKIESLPNDEYNIRLREGNIDLNTLYLLTGVAENKDAIVGIYFGELPYLGGYLPRYIPVERVVLDKIRFNVEAGFETWIGASVHPSNSSFRMLDYEIQNKEIISINRYGKIKGLKKGHTFVTIRAKDNPAVFETISVTVSKTIADSMEINEPESLDVTVGCSVPVKVEITPSGINNKLYWVTSDRRTAIIDYNGVVTGLTPGNCYITGYTTDGTALKDSLLINVIEKIIYSENLIINNLKTELFVGDFYKLDYTIIPDNVSNNKIKLFSSNTDILDVNSDNSTLHAKSIGDVLLNIKTADGKVNYGNLKIKVRKPIILAESVELQPLDNKYLGDIFDIFYNIFPINADNYKEYLEIECDSNQIEKICDNGEYRFIAINPGSAKIKITITDENDNFLCSDIKNIEILGKDIEVPVTSIKIIDKLIINKDERPTVKLNCAIEPVVATNKQVYWRSSNDTVVSVDSEGVLTAKSYGVATITCYSVYGNFSSSCIVTVTGTEVPVSTVSLLINENYKKILVNEQYKLPVVVYPADACNKKLKYKSSNNTIATVLEDGTIIGLTKGVCEITATSESDLTKSVSCTVTVVENINDVLAHIIRIENQLLNVIKDKKLQLRIKILPTDTTDQEILWSTSNNLVAVVDKNGLVFGRSEGSCYIRAYNKASNIETTVEINVISEDDDSSIGSVSLLNGYTKKCSAYNIFSQDFKTVPSSLAETLNPLSTESDYPFVAGVNGNTVICQNVDGFTIIRSKFENNKSTNLHLFVNDSGTYLKDFNVVPSVVTILEGETVKLRFQCDPYNFALDENSLIYDIVKNDDNDKDVIKIEDGNITGITEGIVSIFITYDALDNDPITTSATIRVVNKDTMYENYDIIVSGNIATIYNDDYFERYLLYSELPYDVNERDYIKLDDNGVTKYLRLTNQYSRSLFKIGDGKQPTSGFSTNLIPRYNFRYGNIRKITFKNQYLTEGLVDTARNELSRINSNFKLIEDENSKNIVEEDRYADTWNGLTESTVNKYGFVDTFNMYINRQNFEINDDNTNILKNITLHEFLHVLGFDDLDDVDQNELNVNTILSYYRDKLVCNTLQPTDVYTLLDMYGLESDITDLQLGSGYKISSTKLVGGDNDMLRTVSFSYDAIPDYLLSEKSDIVVIGFADKIETKKINISGSRIMEYDVVTFLISEVEKGRVDNTIEVKFPVDKVNIDLGENYLLYLKDYGKIPASPLNLTNAIKKL